MTRGEAFALKAALVLGVLGLANTLYQTWGTM
jgi:hypothetical protein